MRKALRFASRLIIVLLILALLAAIAAWWLARGSLATLDGEHALEGLSAPATVTRDALGIATVEAANEADAARALGFLHAQERYFEMDLLRRSAAGELSALFGAIATSRVARPVTRFCRYGGGVALVLAIALTHFIGMTGVTVVPDASAALPADMLPESVLTVVLMLVTVLILSIGSMTYVIDRQSTKSAVERYRQLSLHDALTGLPNRSAFVERLSDMLERPGQVSAALPLFDEWHWVSAYPGITVSTAEARAILPKHYRRADIVDHGRNIATFIHALYAGDRLLAAEALVDVVAEPYRKQLIPRFDAMKAAMLELGALAVGISGSGPSIFAVAPTLSQAQAMEQWLKQNFLQNERGFAHVCHIDARGTRVVE